MLRIVPHNVPRVGRSYEHFPDGFELHLLQGLSNCRAASREGSTSNRQEDNFLQGWGPTLPPHAHQRLRVHQQCDVNYREIRRDR
jgi:hypothetical protein